VRALVIVPSSATDATLERRTQSGSEWQAQASDSEQDGRWTEYARPAAEMYTNPHNRLVVDGVRSVRDHWGPGILDLAILSGGYGLLQPDEIVVPYDVSFDELDSDALEDLAAYLRLREQSASLVCEYDLVFYLLSGHFLSLLNLPLDVPDSVHQILLTAQESLPLVPPVPNLFPIVADGGVAARRWHVKAPYVRGFLFDRLCRQMVQHGPAFLEWLYYQPGDTDPMFYKRAKWQPQWELW
jgi:hypothetical protein